MKSLNTLGAILPTLLIAGALTAQEPKFDWQKISTEKAEIQFPGTPQDNGKKGANQWELKRQGGRAALILMASEMPKGSDASNAEFVKNSMDNGRKTTVASLKGAKLVSEKDFVLGKKHPARDIDISVPGLGLYRTRFILTPTHFYRLVALGPKDYLNGEEVKSFFDSFQVKD